MVVFNATDESLSAIQKIHGDNVPTKMDLDGCKGRCWWNDKISGCFIAIKPMRPSDMFSVMAHELVHWLNYLYKARGIEHHLDNDEPTAYLMGWAHKHLYKSAVDAAHAWNRRPEFKKNRKKKK